MFRLSFGPKSFVVVSDAEVARYMLMTNASNYTKGVLSEILDFVMGKGASALLCSMAVAVITPMRKRRPEEVSGVLTISVHTSPLSGLQSSNKSRLRWGCIGCSLQQNDTNLPHWVGSHAKPHVSQSTFRASVWCLGEGCLKRCQWPAQG